MNKILILLLVLMMLSACSEDKSSGPKTIDWPDLAQKEDCIKTLKMAYEHMNIDKYEEILLCSDSESDYFPEGYIWYNNLGVVSRYGVSYDYDQDLIVTSIIFDEAQYLQLWIFDNEWTEILEFRGEPCSNCWTTTMEYYVEMYCKSEDRGWVVSSLISFVIGPDRNSGNTYLIYEAADGNYSYGVDQGGVPKRKLAFGGSMGKWSEIKGYYMPD